MDELQQLAHDIAGAAQDRGLTIAAAESISAGNIASALAAAPGASDWFGASIVAYHTAMKQQILGVETDAVITPECARQMAEGALRLTGADLVVATTGVGGPDPEEGKPAGTVIICAGTRDALQVYEHDFDGSPEQIVDQATLAALEHLREVSR